MAIIEKFNFKSHQDGLMIACVMVKPETTCHGVVQLVHGMAEHKERYLEFMQYLADHGYVSVMHDHRGHGESVLTEDDLGYFYGEHAVELVEDIHQLNQELKKQYPKLPLFLFGHSMGSLLVRAYCKQYDADIDGLLVCGSPSENPAAKAGKMLVKAMRKVKGDHYRSNLIQKMAFGSHHKGFEPSIESDNIWLCRDTNVVASYDQDPLCGFVFTLNGFENLFDLMISVYDPKGWKCHHPDLPIRFLAGSKDPCIISERKFREAAGFMKTIGYKNVTARLFEECRHEILNESNRLDVYVDIVNFFDDVRENLWKK